MPIDSSVSTCSRNRCMILVSSVPFISHRFRPFDCRDEMVREQTLQFRNPVGQQVKLPSRFLIFGLTTPLDRSSDAKTGQYHLVNHASTRSSISFDTTDWQLWTAATLTDQTLRTNIIRLVRKYASSRLNNRPFPDRYNSSNGQMYTFSDRTVVGGHFAPVCFSTALCPGFSRLILLIPILFSSLFQKSKGAPTAAVVAMVIKIRTAVNQLLVLRFCPSP